MSLRSEIVAATSRLSVIEVLTRIDCLLPQQDVSKQGFAVDKISIDCKLICQMPVVERLSTLFDNVRLKCHVSGTTGVYDCAVLKGCDTVTCCLLSLRQTH